MAKVYQTVFERLTNFKPPAVLGVSDFLSLRILEGEYVMKRTLWVTGLAMVAILSPLFYSTPRAGEILHHEVMADSEGSVYDCLSCHDGTIGSPVTLSTMIGNFFGNHPVNRDYPPVGKSEFYVPEEMVAIAGIKLVNGQITCITCHNLKNQKKYHLIMSMDKSDLCFNCHII